MVVVNSWGIGTDHFGGYAGKKGHVSNVFYVSNGSTFQTFLRFKRFYVSNVFTFQTFLRFKRFLSCEHFFTFPP